ncbi:MAG TPA: pantoate--beta-alanine ligase [Nocardioidaceae bacterium]|nr:pantoate--beta-alanine ligase [Nocardioidaceae bacterium]
MIVATTVAELRDARGADRVTALVPTMGALHAGHRRLIDVAHGTADQTAVSIFVNPLQFAAGEDLDRYPRTMDADLEVCASAGVAVVFAPGGDTMYPSGEPIVTVDPGPLGSELEGAVRPGHFRGVLTVVAKLFALVRPASAVFGEKDYQQLALIRQMAADLSTGVEVVSVETVRDSDGLALSSRNRYLAPNERATALALNGALRAGRQAGAEGAAAVLSAAKSVLASESELSVDYLELRAADLSPAPAAGGARLLVAARVGGTRLIDNLSVEIGEP